VELIPEELSTNSLYKLLTGTIVPRPIGWISSIDTTGKPNLAPFSFFNAICPNPPHVLFCPGIRDINQAPKDTLNNVKATGEFVVNIVTETTVNAMNMTATELPPAIDEFEFANLTPVPATVVKPPRVAESPVNYECKLVHIYEVGDHPGSGSVVIGQVERIHVNDRFIDENHHIDLAQLQPIGRLTGNEYCRVTDLFDLTRLPPQL